MIGYDLIATIINIQQNPTMSHESVPMFVDTSHLGTARRRGLPLFWPDQLLVKSIRW